MKTENLTQENFTVQVLGKTNIQTPLSKTISSFATDERRIPYHSHTNEIKQDLKINKEPLSFELAGPREKLYFDPTSVNCAIVTCGGLCPGINDVIRSIVYESYHRYGVKKVYGFRYGYKGMIKENNIPPILLNSDIVNNIHELGGTILGSSRGGQNVEKIVDYLQELEISILYTIGGDGTLRGATEIADTITKRGLNISVVGIPKTIDNDISCVRKTFGFETAVEASRAVIRSAHIESKGLENGIGLVKLMGRDSGFIAAKATLANADVNFCMIPEVKVKLDGLNGLLEKLEKRLARRHHAVIVVAEGAGQYCFDSEPKLDESGNVLKKDIGVFLKDKINKYMKSRGIKAGVKYIDPSYIIRSQPANANDSIFCLQLGQNAVHAGMSGKTNLLIGYWNDHYTNLPIPLAISERKKVKPTGRLWQTVISVTE